MLQLVDIVKRFGKVEALKNVSIALNVGEVVGLVGENGAGKSTLMKVLNGVHQPDGGAIRMHGEVVAFNGPRAAARLGVGMVYQEQSLIPNLSVAENIFLGAEDRFLRFGKVNWRAMRGAAAQQLAKVGLAVDPAAITADLSFIQRQMVEIAKALTLEESVAGNLCILLDEPTSMLDQAEIDILFALIGKLKQRAGIIFVSHRLDEVIAISDRIYILKDGAMVREMAKAEATPPEIHRLMVGRTALGSYYRQEDRRPPSDPIALEARQLTRASRYRDISFRLRAGEVLAFVGTEGSGAEALMRSIFGLEPFDGGALQCFGVDRAAGSVGVATRLGLGYVPRERKIEGVIEDMTVEDNIILAAMRKLTRWGVFDFSRMRRATRDLIARMRVKTPDGQTLCAHLSGGNQQKVVLAKWRHAEARVYLLDHPTRGLDVGAKEDVYALIREFCAAGGAVVLIGDTLEEALGLAHTLIVMRDGRETARFDNTSANPPAPLDLIQHMV
jgi:ribose transport system ATP-binding protein